MSLVGVRDIIGTTRENSSIYQGFKDIILTVSHLGMQLYFFLLVYYILSLLKKIELLVLCGWEYYF